jgi:putative peptidoglycan lipid II flippase
MGIFAVAVATASMPRLSKQAAAGDLEGLKRTYVDTTRLTLFIILPAMVGLLVLGAPILAVLFERGRFTPAMTVATQQALVAFAISLWAAAGIRITVSVYFALEDSRTPVRVAAVALGVYLAAGLVLMWPLGHVGLALAISLSSMANFGLLLWLLRRKIGRLGLRSVVRSALRSLGASGVMGGVAWGLWQLWLRQGGGGGWPRAAALLGVVGLSGGCYWGVARAFGSPEVREVLDAVRRRR